jgi:hypothetical protein
MRVSVTTTVPGRVVEAEELWYDPHRWAAWIDGFGHVAKLEGEWPQVGARLLWDSRPQGRGRVLERVVAYEPRSGQSVEVEDERLTGLQTVAFEPDGDRVRLSLSLDYSLKEGNRFVDFLFIRRAVRDSLRRTLTRFEHERRAEVTRS